MSEEEKKAIEVLKEDYKLAKREDSVDIDVFTNYLRSVLNLIKKQEKVIDEMSEKLVKVPVDENNPMAKLLNANLDKKKEAVKQYFYRKVEEDV